MLIPSLLVLATYVLPVGSPDTFWLEPPPARDAVAVEGNQPRAIEGVLLDQDGDSYHIRVAGGEIWLPKAQVVKVDKTGLTVADLERSERQAAERRAAEAKAEAEAPAPAVVEPAPRAKPAVVVEVEERESASAEACAMGYDPVLGVARCWAEGACHYQLMLDLDLAYEATRDRDYIRLLRKLRRLH